MPTPDPAAPRVEFTIRGEIDVLHLKPGDVLIVHIDTSPTADDVETITRNLRRVFPDHKAVVLEPGLLLTTAREAPDA